MRDITEDTWTSPRDWCLTPGLWHADTKDATEWEVSDLVAAFVRALQPEFVLETGTNTGQTTMLIGEALEANGHGRLVSIETDPNFCNEARDRCIGLPVEIINGSSLDYVAPEPIGFAFFDSLAHMRHLEIERFWGDFVAETIIAVHDTGPQHPVLGHLRPLIDDGQLRVVNLHTPRGVLFAQVMK